MSIQFYVNGNLVSDGGSYHVGDSWKIVAPSSYPNSEVYVLGSQNGAGPSKTTIGATDVTGQYTLTGQFTASDIGTWFEQWGVVIPTGSSSLGQLSFTVNPAVVTQSQSTTGSTGSNTQTNTTNQGNTTNTTPVTSNVFGLSNTELVLIGLAAIGVVYMISKGDR